MKGANEVEMGKQFARSELAKNLSEDYTYLGMIRRGEHVTVMYKVINKKDNGEWLGRLVLGYEKDNVRIFGCTLF
jgi:peroxiredoxin family protein